MKRIFVLTLAMMFCMNCGNSARAQQPNTGNRILSYATILDGDTIPLVHLIPVIITAPWALLSQKEIRRNQKLIRNVKKTLPYAKEARRRLKELDRELASMNPNYRKEYIKRVERELIDEFEDDLMNLTISQGAVLLKLVDRETGNSSYALVSDLRGKLRASFYQSFARLFGFNLKSRYDPQHNKEDNLLERVARSVELGKI